MPVVIEELITFFVTSCIACMKRKIIRNCISPNERIFNWILLEREINSWFEIFTELKLLFKYQRIFFQNLFISHQSFKRSLCFIFRYFLRLISWKWRTALHVCKCFLFLIFWTWIWTIWIYLRCVRIGTRQVVQIPHLQLLVLAHFFKGIF